MPALIGSAARKLNNVLTLSRIGSGPLGLIDVGSVGGLHSRWRRYAGKLGYLLNFEPGDAPVRKRYMCTYNVGLWRDDATLPFHVYRGNSGMGASLFEQNFEFVDDHWNTLKSIGPKALADTWHERSALSHTLKLECRALDSVLAQEGLLGRMHFLKVDAQGAEFEILEGAGQFLAGDCVGLQLELFRIPLYRGIRLRDEVVEYLYDLQFELVHEFPPHGTFNSQNDCVFLHRSRGSREIRETIQKVYQIGSSQG